MNVKLGMRDYAKSDDAALVALQYTYTRTRCFVYRYTSRKFGSSKVSFAIESLEKKNLTLARGLGWV